MLVYGLVVVLVPVGNRPSSGGFLLGCLRPWHRLAPALHVVYHRHHSFVVGWLLVDVLDLHHLPVHQDRNRLRVKKCMTCKLEFVLESEGLKRISKDVVISRQMYLYSTFHTQESRSRCFTSKHYSIKTKQDFKECIKDI